MDSSSVTIPTLTATNYKPWSIAVQAAVMRKGALSVLNGTKTKPSDPDALEKWENLAQISAGYVLGSLSPEAMTHVTDITDGPLMWKELKDHYSATSSANRINNLEALLTVNQKPDESLSELLGRVNTLWNDYTQSQSTGVTVATLNDELFCWAFIRSLNSALYDPLRHSLVKESDLTKAKISTQVKATQDGLFASKAMDSALVVHHHSTPSSSNTSVSDPCAWCISKGRTNVAQTHTMATCTGLKELKWHS